MTFWGGEHFFVRNLLYITILLHRRGINTVSLWHFLCGATDDARGLHGEPLGQRAPFSSGVIKVAGSKVPVFCGGISLFHHFCTNNGCRNCGTNWRGVIISVIIIPCHSELCEMTLRRFTRMLL